VVKKFDVGQILFILKLTGCLNRGNYIFATGNTSLIVFQPLSRLDDGYPSK